MSKPWGRAGAWALEAERAEAEERERADGAASGSFSGGSNLFAGQPAQSFPSLKEAVTKPKKKKGVAVTLSVFTTGNYVGPGGARRESSLEPKGLTHDEMIRLPTGPRERTAEELEHSRLGGGFRSYGYGGGGGGGVPPRRRSEFGMDDETRRGASIPRATDPDLPSRADEVDNWATSKKFTPTMDSGRQERYGSLGSGGSSKADEVDNWSLGKKSTAPPPSRNSGFGSGFRDSPVPGADSDRWVRGGKGSFSSNGERERPRLILDHPKRDSVSQSESARSRPSPFGTARPREEVLAEKGMDWRKMETEIEDKKIVRPTSSHSSRPSSAQSSRPGSPISQISGEGGAAKPRPKVNPFGDAKPREVLLEAKGMDWRKIDLELEHRSVERSLTDEEKILKEEIDHLKNELADKTDNKVNSDSAHISSEQIRNLHELIMEKEKELNQLASVFDDKVRFGQKTSTDGRPGSGSGRTAFSADRPPSQSNISDDSRNIEFMDRPRSRGSDSWSRPMDDRRGFSRSKESGFLSSRNVDRAISRERW